ncbi:MAG: MFS transporter [Bacteriovoracaceae bacterium]|nr:MFS transporter [Bacteriovoracaceae bacterium]
MSTQNISREKLVVAILATVQFCHMVDFVVMMPLGPLMMKKFSISPVEFAGLVSSYNIAACFSGLVLGAIADRYDLKRLLVLAFFGLALGTFLCGYSSSFSELLSARIFTGLFGGAVNGLVMASISHLVPYERRGKAMGAIMGAFSAASVLGVPLGLAVADRWGFNSTFYCIAAFSVIPLFLLALCTPGIPAGITKLRFVEVVKKYRHTLSYQRNPLGHVMIFIVSFSMFLLIPFIAPFSVQNMGILQSDLKFMYLVGGLVTVVTSRLFGKMTDRYGAFRVFNALALGAIIPILVFTNTGPITLVSYIILMSVFMSVVSGRMIPCMTMITEIPGPKERGTYLGLLGSVRALGSASSTFIGGLIIGQGASGELTRFDLVGYLSVALMLTSLFMAYKINSSKQLHS